VHPCISAFSTFRIPGMAILSPFAFSYLTRLSAPLIHDNRMGYHAFGTCISLPCFRHGILLVVNLWKALLVARGNCRWQTFRSRLSVTKMESIYIILHKLIVIHVFSKTSLTSSPEVPVKYDNRLTLRSAVHIISFGIYIFCHRLAEDKR